MTPLTKTLSSSSPSSSPRTSFSTPSPHRGSASREPPPRVSSTRPARQGGNHQQHLHAIFSLPTKQGKQMSKSIAVKRVGSNLATETLQIEPGTTVAECLKTLGLAGGYQLSDAQNPDRVYRPDRQPLCHDRRRHLALRKRTRRRRRLTGGGDDGMVLEATQPGHPRRRPFRGG